jgi:hypothetical protein
MILQQERCYSMDRIQHTRYRVVTGYSKQGIEASSSIKRGVLPFQERFCLYGDSLLVSCLAETVFIFHIAECYWLTVSTRVYSNLKHHGKQ